ncbi:hypothetical protein [Thermomonas sp. HDW16]|uniref:hypothetical protein n=1 Tax=Thermomonas sp. HDW16 TaxID=2714945 RepID=UPI0014076529|nr:hypothetical protein [Thermomonas sp. HDW16]QIL19493.1 hypothetical protein G7079_01385 [Thermomonas sp. HDW16]
MKISIAPVWKEMTPDLVEELVDFWRDNKAIEDPAIAKRRAAQVVCIARDENGALCGVGTALIKVLPRLRQPMYYYRQFFAKALRGQHQELAFYQQCKQVLQGYNQGLKKPESLGLLVEVENSKIAAAYKRAYEPSFDATFIGYSPRGLQLRVSYFDDAQLLIPVPLRKQGPAARGTAQHDPAHVTPATRRGKGRS